MLDTQRVHSKPDERLNASCTSHTGPLSNTIKSVVFVM